MDRPVTVFGAAGHTGRFVVSELHRRGWTPILSGRDAGRLSAVGDVFPGSAVRVASVEDAASLDRALATPRRSSIVRDLSSTPQSPMIDAALRAPAFLTWT